MDFERYLREQQRSLFRFAVVLTGDVVAAEDLLADVLGTAFEKWSQVAAADHPHAYVRRMLVNAFIRSRRRGARFTTHADLETFAEPITDHSAGHAERDWLLAQMRRLPARQRAAVVLRYYEGLSFAEIAAVLGTGENAVRSNISRALRRLRIQLSENADPADFQVLEV
jgi:RNA polymerase sigma-70 factor (sigma-E family)